jgi:minor extracellular serine protease Vpr
MQRYCQKLKRISALTYFRRSMTFRITLIAALGYISNSLLGQTSKSDVDLISYNPKISAPAKIALKQLSNNKISLFDDENNFFITFQSVKDNQYWKNQSQFSSSHFDSEFPLSNGQYIITARLNASDVSQFLLDDHLVHLEVASRLNSPRPLDDRSKSKSQVDQLHNLKDPGPIKGEDVIVGVVDIGFQTTHPTFYNENGSKYRVKRFWHQGYPNQDGPKPFRYGILFSDQSSILKAVDYDGSHGTHVAGIAAGSGYKSPDLKFSGMAPNADLVFVGIKYKNDTLNGSALGDLIVANSTILDGFQYIFNYADSVDKPVVSNLSWGMHTGPHDGTSLFDLSLESMLNKNYTFRKSNKGKVLVGANGNSARENMHIEFDLNNDTLETLAMDRSREYYKSENVYCDFWAEKDANIQMKITLIDSQNNELVSTSYFNFHSDSYKKVVLNQGNDSLQIVLSSQKKYINNEKSNVLLMAEANSNKRFIKISFAGNGVLHGWNSGRTYEWTSGTFRSYIRSLKPSNWIEGDEKYTVIENGGTSKAILAVGAYNNRVNWINAAGEFKSDSAVAEGQIAGFSSNGPTVDGRLKPNISAPGQYITSSYHKDQLPGWLMPYVLHIDSFNNDKVYYAMASGTSMAAPHAAGIVALLLQHTRGNLTYSQMIELIQSSAKKDEFTGSNENNIYGHGKIQAFSTYMASSIFANTQSHEPKSQIQPWFLKDGNQMEIKGIPQNLDLNMAIYDLSGRTVFQESIGQKRDLNITDLRIPINGVYIIRLTGERLLSSTLVVF